MSMWCGPDLLVGVFFDRIISNNLFLRLVCRSDSIGFTLESLIQKQALPHCLTVL